MVTFRVGARAAWKVAAVSAAAIAGYVGLGSGLAGADNTDLKPDPWAHSRQAADIRGNATQGDVRAAEILETNGQGESRQSSIAVPNTRARGYDGVRVGPGIGSW